MERETECLVLFWFYEICWSVEVVSNDISIGFYFNDDGGSYHVTLHFPQHPTYHLPYSVKNTQ